MDLFVVLVLVFLILKQIFLGIFFSEKKDDKKENIWYTKKKGIWRNGRRYGLNTNF